MACRDWSVMGWDEAEVQGRPHRGHRAPLLDQALLAPEASGHVLAVPGSPLLCD